MHFESMEYAELTDARKLYEYVEISIFPLSFSETLLFRRQYNTDAADSIQKQFYEFLRRGGFPVLWIASY